MANEISTYTHEGMELPFEDWSNALHSFSDLASIIQSQGRRITFLYDNQRYFLEKYYLYSPKKHEYLDYIEQYPRSAS